MLSANEKYTRDKAKLWFFMSSFKINKKREEIITKKRKIKDYRRPVFLREKLVLVDLAATTLGSVAGPFFPLVWYYHLC